MLKPHYDLLSTNVLLLKGKKKRILAEIDVVAVRGKEIDVFEVKCNPRRIIKAKKQLRRIKRIMPNVSNTYFFSGDSGIVKKME